MSRAQPRLAKPARRKVHSADAGSAESGIAFVLIQHLDPARGSLLGFLTREFTVPASEGAPAEELAAVYVPTNHLYLGDVLIVRVRDLRYPALTVEQGIRVFLTGGMALPASVPVQATPPD